MGTRTQTRVAEYMSSPVETVSADASLVEAADAMREQNISALVVESDPRSIVTSTDVVGVVADARDPRDLSVTDVATDVVVTATPDQPMQQAAATMLQSDSSHLPVVEDGDLVGILSKTDITERQSA